MRALLVARKDLRQAFADKKSLLFLVVMPIVFTLFMGAMFGSSGSEDPRLAIAVVLPEAADSAVLDALKRLLEASEAIRPEFLDAGERESLQKAVRDREIAGGIIVPEGFADALLVGELVPMELVLDPSSPEAGIVRQAVNMVGTRLMMALEAARMAKGVYDAQVGNSDDATGQAFLEESLCRAVAAWEDRNVKVEMATVSVGADDSEIVPTGFEQMSPGIMVQFVILGLTMSGTVVVLERRSGTLKRMLSTPIRRSEIVGGHLLAMFVIVLAQETILILFGELVLGVPYLAAPVAILVVMASLALFAASLGLLIGAVARGEDQTIMFSLIAMFVLCSLGGAWYPLEATGEVFSTIGHLTPTAWAMDGFQNVILRGQGLSSVLVPAAVLLVWATLCFGLAVRRLRAE